MSNGHIEEARRGLALAMLALTMSAVSCLAAELPARTPVALKETAKGTAGTANRLALPVRLPGSQNWFLEWATNDWVHAAALEFDIAWPDNAPTNAQILVHVVDWDYLWYQHLAPGYLSPGVTNHYRINLSVNATDWSPVGHKATWHGRVLLRPKEVGVRIFGDSRYSGDVELSNVFVSFPTETPAAPTIRHVRANADRVKAYELFELTFKLPDRYPDPFDGEAVAVAGRFTGPDGHVTEVDGYYGRHYYRIVDPDSEKIVPQGPPYWRVRFTPRKPGVYRYELSVRDEYGKAEWGPATVQVDPSDNPGYIRVSARDPRFFEHDDGSYYFPLGHNVRSPFDTRMDTQFPWAERQVYGTDRYRHYFRNMSKHGENLAEVWTASWSLGLEWLEEWQGYHGIGQYNMRNAWELDRVMESARDFGIYINLVIHNHGKFSSFVDQEWDNNPFNVANGGYLEKPSEVFSNERAMNDYRKLVRYMVARWGHSPYIFAWELWSELDLTGEKGTKAYRTPECVDWHRLMGRVVKDFDPYDHMVGTHVCQDYTRQNDEITNLPEMDFCPVDAYHSSDDPLHIVTLLRNTARHNLQYGKPSLVTEFGGSPHGENVDNLEASLHAALWASTALDLGGAPMFWWWELIEEENYYPKYAAVSAFMKGVDRRDPDLQEVRLHVEIDGVVTSRAAVECMAGPRQALGWVYRKTLFANNRARERQAITGAEITVRNLDDAAYTVEFWNTELGRPLNAMTITAQNGRARLKIPPFERDIAFKLKVK